MRRANNQPWPAATVQLICVPAALAVDIGQLTPPMVTEFCCTIQFSTKQTTSANPDSGREALAVDGNLDVARSDEGPTTNARDGWRVGERGRSALAADRQVDSDLVTKARWKVAQHTRVVPLRWAVCAGFAANGDSAASARSAKAVAVQSQEHGGRRRGCTGAGRDRCNGGCGVVERVGQVDLIANRNDQRCEANTRRERAGDQCVSPRVQKAVCAADGQRAKLAEVRSVHSQLSAARGGVRGRADGVDHRTRVRDQHVGVAGRQPKGPAEKKDECRQRKRSGHT